MKRWLTAFLLIACSLLVFAGPAAAAYKVPPAPQTSFYVQDYAGILAPATRSRINELGAKMAAETKAQVVVVTVPNLQGEPVEDVALAILRGWGIGDKELNNGVLLLVAIEDRKSYIAVGYGLEGALPDGKVGEIQDTYLLPFFRQGQYEQGIWNTYQAVLKVVGKEYGVEAAEPPQTAGQEQKDGFWWDTAPTWQKLLAGIAVAAFLLVDWVFFGGNITMFLIYLLLRFRGGGRNDRGGGGSGGGGGAGRGW